MFFVSSKGSKSRDLASRTMLSSEHCKEPPRSFCRHEAFQNRNNAYIGLSRNVSVTLQQQVNSNKPTLYEYTSACWSRSGFSYVGSRLRFLHVLLLKSSTMGTCPLAKLMSIPPLYRQHEFRGLGEVHFVAMYEYTGRPTVPIHSAPNTPTQHIWRCFLDMQGCDGLVRANGS